MKKLTAVLCATLGSALAMPAHAQTYLKLTDPGSVTSNAMGQNVYVGNYTGTMTGPGALNDGNPITINCVDYFHDVTHNESWTVSSINLASGVFTDTYYGDQLKYQQAAYLTTFYAQAYQTSNNSEIAAIQHAIWNTVDGHGNYFNDTESLAWTNCVAAALANPNDAACAIDGAAGKSFNSVNYNSFVLLHPVDPQANSAQEMLTTTPEPSSMALLGTGLFGLVPMIRRRRKA